ncbi:HlyD family efflux transporter periplasmic adaptor subunit [Zoogloea sp.]|uniref:HlyD family efflux transporter periplasmic adaptor subunit n=1 Tax=Zoogloea sp. TaxID=49181 RepID=UPI0035AF4D9A
MMHADNFKSTSASAPLDPQTWNAFLTAPTLAGRFQAWLGLIGKSQDRVHNAAILVESAEARAYAPLAVWPQVAQMSHLGGVIEDCLRQQCGVLTQVTERSGFWYVAYPLINTDRTLGVVALELESTEAGAQQLLRNIHWGSAWLINMLAQGQFDELKQERLRYASVLEVLAIALQAGPLQQGVFDLINAIARTLGCSRVAYGHVHTAQVRLQALSDAAGFERNTPLSKAYTAALEEALDAGFAIQTTSSTHVDSTPPALSQESRCHTELLAQTGAEAVLSFPLLHGNHCVAILCLERSQGFFSEADLAWLEAFSGLIAPVIKLKNDARHNSWQRFRFDTEKLFERLFGPQHLVWKFSALATLAFTLLMLIPIEHRVSARTLIEGEIQRVAAAPFDGFLASASVRAGDTVKEGQELARLDDRQLKMEEVRWSSERDQYQNKLQEATANHELASIQILSAQVRQANAQLALVTEKIQRARISAPFAGYVVSGDLSQQIGAPIETGKTLFEIAPLNSYRVVLRVDERDIRYIQTAQRGQLVMTGIAGEPIGFEVVKMLPVAQTEEGKNFFRVEARLDEASQRLRPGMEGIGKIQAGERALGWILTHEFTDWLTLQTWKWLP